jgi:hypothetical protein
MADKKPLEGMAQDDSLGLLRQIFRLLKPLGNVVGGGSNRLQVEASIPTLPTLAAVTTVTTVTTVAAVTALNNITAIGGVSAFDQMKSQNRVGYAVGPRANVKWTV